MTERYDEIAAGYAMYTCILLYVWPWFWTLKS